MSPSRAILPPRARMLATVALPDYEIGDKIIPMTFRGMRY